MCYKNISAGLLAITITLSGISMVRADTVYVVAHGPVSLDSFECFAIRPSSFVNRICYDEQHEHLIVQLENRYYQHCRVTAGTVEAWLNAHSLGRFYNAEVRSQRYDCRLD